MVALAAIVWSIVNAEATTTTVPISQLAQQIIDGEVAELEIAGDGETITVSYKDSSEARSQVSGASSIEEVLSAYGVDGDVYRSQNVSVVYLQPSAWSGVLNIMSFLLPMLLIVGLFYFFMRQSQGANNQAMSFGKSKAKMMTSETPTVTFDAVSYTHLTLPTIA